MGQNRPGDVSMMGGGDTGEMGRVGIPTMVYGNNVFWGKPRGGRRGEGAFGFIGGISSNSGGGAQVHSGDTLEQLTLDHSMVNEALKLNPDLSEDILKQLPTNVVTRALGTKELVEPDLRSEPLVAGDLYLLCSDGLTGG